MDSLQLAELLCARVCHDLSGPVGAAAAGAELFEELGEAPDPETIRLVADAAGGAAQRLKFFRATLGPAASAPQRTAALRDLVDGYLATHASAACPAIQVSWPAAPAALDGDSARLLLNLVLLARDALPRGGRIDIDIAGALPSVTAQGEPAALSEEARQVLQDGQPPAGPRGAQAELARRLAERAGGILTADAMTQGLTLAVRPVGGMPSRPDG